MKVLLTKQFQKSDKEYILERIQKDIILIDPGIYTEESLLHYIKETDILLGTLVTEKLLIEAVNLKFIQVPWTGIENLDFDLLRKYKITVCNSHSNSTGVAEHAVALMMDTAKKISYHDRLLRNGNWNRIISGQENEVSPFSLMISGTKIGIVGFGAIGKKIYNLLSGYNCSFKVFNKENLTGFENTDNLVIFSPDKLHSEITNLDFIFIAVPLTPETRNLIDERFLSAMKPDSVLINISRGEIIHEADLFYALKNRTIAFAAIDVWYNYPTKESSTVFPSSKYDYHLLENIVLSPHRASYVTGSFPHLDDAIENIRRCYFARPPINVVSLEKGY